MPELAKEVRERLDMCSLVESRVAHPDLRLALAHIDALDAELAVRSTFVAEAERINAELNSRSEQSRINASTLAVKLESAEARVADRDAWLSVIADHCDRMAPMPDGRRAHDNKRPIEQHVGMVLSHLTSRLAELRPVVRAAVDESLAEHGHRPDGSWPDTSLERLSELRVVRALAVGHLTPVTVTWAKEGA